MSTSPITIRIELNSTAVLAEPDCALNESDLNARIADELLQRARVCKDRVPLALCFVMPGNKLHQQQEVAHQVRRHFSRMAQLHEQKIRDIFRFARVATALGLFIVVLLLACAQAIPDDAGQILLGVRESLTIFAWVAMWRPAELWLYAHLPERHWCRLAHRLSQATVTIESPRTA